VPGHLPSNHTTSLSQPLANYSIRLLLLRWSNVPMRFAYSLF
jgi:hypothetical protein